MSTPSAAGSPWRGLTVILVAWLFLLWLGYPLPFIDDMWFIGPAVHWVHGGGYYNAYCPSTVLLDPKPEFLIYVPFQGHAVAAWIDIFGVSRLSLAMFQWLMAVLATLGLWIATRRFSSSMLLPLGLVACVATFLGASGLRPEAMGLALVVWSWVIFEMASPVAWFFGGLFLAAAIFTSPNVGAVAPVVGAWVLIKALRGGRWHAIANLTALAVGGALSFLVFLWMINFELSRLLSIIGEGGRLSSTLRNPTVFQALAMHPIDWRDALRDVLQLYVPLFVLCFAIGAMFWRPDLFETAPSVAALLFVAGAAICLFVPEFSSAAGKAPLGFFSISVALVVCLCTIRRVRPYAAALWVVFFSVYLFGFGHQTLQLLCRPHLPAAQAEELRQSIAKVSPAQLYVDEYAAAAVFNYNFPANALDYHFGRTERVATFNPEDFPAGSYLVVSKETLVRVGAYDRYHLGQPPRLMPVIGRLFPLKPANPYDIVIIPGGPVK